MYVSVNLLKNFLIVHPLILTLNINLCHYHFMANRAHYMYNKEIVRITLRLDKTIHSKLKKLNYRSINEAINILLDKALKQNN